MSKFGFRIIGIVLCCGAASTVNAQVKAGGNGLPIWTNVVDHSAPRIDVYSDRGSCPCDGQTSENEANCGIPTDTVNGGCNSTPNAFSTIALGGTVCGTSQIGTLNFRDTDWYRFSISATTNVEWAVRAEYPVQLLILNDICPTTVVSAGTAATCTEGFVRAVNLAPGNYIAFVSPQQGTPFFACETGSNQYVGSLRTFVPPPPPANDNCASAACFIGTSVSGTTVDASPDCVGCCFISPDVWYSYTPATSGAAVFSTCVGTPYDSVLSAYDTCGGSQLVCVDDACGLQSRITVNVTAGVATLIRISGFGNATGAFTLTLESGPEALLCATTCYGTCVADFDDGSGSGMPDGGVTIDDLLYYLGLFEAGDICADVDDGSAVCPTSVVGTPDGGVTIDDLLFYLCRFEEGC